MAETKRAVIVGINEYQDATIPALKGAEQDAEDVRDILTKQGDFEVAQEHFLVGSRATHDAVQGAISDLFWRTDPSAVTLFYFSGHGIKDSYGKGYLFPYDMEKERPLVRGIEMRGLRELALQSLHKEAIVLILDCCYAGVAADANAKGGFEALDTASKSFSGMADVEPKTIAKKGVFVFSSSAADQTSRELLGRPHKLGKGESHNHGAFSFQLIEGLTGLAADKQENISVEALRKHVDRELRGNPNQTFELFTSGATNPEGIILARATDVVQITASLEMVTAYLESSDYKSWILAAAALSRVLKDRPDYPAANDLRSKVEECLVECRMKSLTWLMRNNLALMQQARTVSGTLQAFVVDLSLEQIGVAQHNPQDSTMGLAMTLAEAVQKDWAVEKLLPFLQACETGPTPSLPQAKMGSRGGQ